jgi:hypothetical protein
VILPKTLPNCLKGAPPSRAGQSKKRGKKIGPNRRILPTSDIVSVVWRSGRGPDFDRILIPPPDAEASAEHIRSDTSAQTASSWP